MHAKKKGHDFLLIFNFSFILSQYLKTVIQCFIWKKNTFDLSSYPVTATTFDHRNHNFLLMLKSNKTSELQIRGGIDNNSKIIFLISQRKHTL